MYIPCHMTKSEKVGYTTTLNGLENRTHGFSIHTILATRTFQGNDDTPGLTFANALRTDVLTVRQGNVDDTSLMWRHGLEGNRTTIVAYLLCHTQRKRAQVLLAALAIIFCVHNDAHTVLGTMPDNQANQEL